MEKIKADWNKNGYRLSSFEEGRAEKYYTDCFSKRDEEVMRLTGTAELFTHDRVVSHYNQIVNDPDRYDFILTDPEGKFIGESVINEIDWTVKAANFRIVIFDSGNCSKGIGTWAVERARDFAFERLHLHRLELSVFSFNPRAQKVYKKAGFHIEGVKKDAVPDGDGYADEIVMAVLEEDWRKIKGLDRQVLPIRNETEKDYRAVEEMTRRAFYNVHVPGCAEHYLAHVMRGHEDFVPQLDFVLELDGRIVANIMYTKAKLVDEMGQEKEILTFGPVSVEPEYQRNGFGKQLMEYSFRQAAALGYDVIVIFGSPSNYVSSGFFCCKKYNVCLENGKYPAAMLVKELVPHALSGKKWIYRESSAMAVDEEVAETFDESFEKLEKKYRPSQEEFYIMSHAFIE